MIGVGDKVVMVSALKDRALSKVVVFPQVGQVYTIRDIEVANDGVYYFFEEIINKERDCIDGFGEDCFWSERFRPVHTTDISVFLEIAKNHKIKIKGPKDKERVDA